MVLAHLSCLVDAACLAALAGQETEPSLATVWQARPTDQLVSLLLLLLLLPAAAVEAAGSAWSCVVPGLEVCLASNPDLLDQRRFLLRDAAALTPGWEEVAVVAVVGVLVVSLALPVFQEQLAAEMVDLVLESPPSYSVVSQAAGLAVAAVPAAAPS